MTATKHGPSWLKFEDGQWSEIPESVATIRRIYDLAIKGSGPDVIAASLAEASIPTLGRRSSASQEWTTKMIDKLLRSQAVIGLAEDKLGNAIACYPDIIAYDDWLFVQEIRGVRSSGRKGTIGNLFSNRILCATCGSSLRFRPVTERRKLPYLTCPKRCIGQIDYAQLELWVLGYLGKRGLQTSRLVRSLVRESVDGRPLRPIAELAIRLFRERDNRALRLAVQVGLAQLIDRIAVSPSTIDISCKDGTRTCIAAELRHS